mgnify:FL=1
MAAEEGGDGRRNMGNHLQLVPGNGGAGSGKAGGGWRQGWGWLWGAGEELGEAGVGLAGQLCRGDRSARKR